MSLATQEAEVVEVHQLCPDVRQMVLRPLQHPISFRPGQWISVYLPIDEKPLVRAYTIAEPPSEKETVALCFDRVKEGAASSYLFGLRPGDRITVSDALGNFVMPADIRAGLVLVTWFTGIVPLRCMLLDMARWDREPPTTLLLYGAPSEDELPYHTELRALEQAHGWFTYVPVISNVGDNLETRIDRVLRHLPTAIKGVFPNGIGPHDVHPMIAGIRALVLPARAWFVQNLGFLPAQVQKETYD